MTDDALADRVAGIVESAFDAHRSWFKEITRRARRGFEHRAWQRMRGDARERLGLYKRSIDAVTLDVRAALGPRVDDRAPWRAVKRRYLDRVASRHDVELAETFFNSTTRRLFSTVGVNPDVEFVYYGRRSAAPDPPESVFETYAAAEGTEALARSILSGARISANFEDLDRDARLAATRLDERLTNAWGHANVAAADVLRPAFFRNKGAYLVGRLRGGSHPLPLVLALLHGGRGVWLDAVLCDEDDASIVFSFTHTYFHVDVEHPRPLIEFLASIMPRKPVAELYISLGYDKHGKTEMYRDLVLHLATSDDLFEAAPGTRGMVMTVFTLPSYDLVFKVIKDRFDYPKSATPRAVREKYGLVAAHDRAGRLLDTQEFEHLTFPRARFQPALLDELTRVAAANVRVAGDEVVVRHLYAERRIVPLNLYLERAEEAAARAAILDFGCALEELAENNIFPGDLLLKNWGVTRHGRVAFYDYDEVCLLTECRFRAFPRAASADEELAAEPWYSVGDNDVFPAEFATFLIPKGPLRDAFAREHGDLFRVEFWQEAQRHVRSGWIADVFPYARERRLRT
jgi:isocitrate dehydrogenase kinase/phosphatase